MLRTCLILGPVILLTGCASSIGAFFNRPVVQDKVGESVGTLSQSADRRTVLVAVAGAQAGKFCAEPPPDTAVGIKTDLQATFESQAKKLGIGDKLETTVNVLADRTPALDMFRTGTYALCQYQLNGQLTPAEVSEHFRALIAAFVDVEKARSSAKPPTASAGAASVPAR